MAADGERPGPQGPATAPGGLLDVLGVAAVVLDGRGRIALWSPPAEALFGHTGAEALGQDALDLLVGGTRPGRAWEDFTRATADGGVRAGAFPARHKDGRTVEVEFRTMRLQAGAGQWCVLGITSERRTLARLERDLALSARMVGQAPIGLAVLDTELRYVLVNEALERINGVPAADHLGRTRARSSGTWTSPRSRNGCGRSWPPGSRCWRSSPPGARSPTSAANTPGPPPTTGWTTGPATYWGWPSR